MTMFQDHFKAELIKRGYPEDLSIEYNLDHTQGSGVAFYGSLETSDIKRLMTRLLCEDNGNAVSRVRSLMDQKHFDNMMTVIDHFGLYLGIEKNSYGYHYSHANTMDLNCSVHFVDLFADGEYYGEFTIDGLDEAMVDQWHDIWIRFFEALEQDIRSVSWDLETDGHAIVEATPDEDEVVWERSTKHYRVRVTEVPDRDFDIGHWDESLKLETLREIADCKQRYLGLQVEVLSNTEDEDDAVVLGDARLYGIVINPDDKTYAGLKQDLLQEAVQRARELLSHHVKAE